MPLLSSANEVRVKQRATADALRDLADGTPEPARELIIAYGDTLGKHSLLPGAAGELYAAVYRETRGDALPPWQKAERRVPARY